MLDPNLKSLRAMLLLTTQVAPIVNYIDAMDRKVLRRRCDGEGVSFVCSLLPQLGKALDAALETGQWVTPVGFSNQRGTCLPKLFNRAFSYVFTQEGVLKDIESVDKIAVLTLRQVCLLAGKCEFGSNTAQEDACWSSFRDNQARIAAVNLEHVLERPVVRNTKLSAVLAHAKKLVHALCADFDVSQLVPRHGSGSCPEKLPPHQRYDVANMVYNEKLASVFDYSHFMFLSPNHLSDDLDLLQTMPEQDVFHDRAAYVPKDYGKSRGISLVPSTLMFFQQALAGYLKEKMGSRAYAREIDISDQSRNQELARLGSLEGVYATLDLSDASDSLKTDLVSMLFPDSIARCLFAARSTGVERGGEYQEYACFAPMGAATCFPVQTIVFWSLAKAASRIALGREARVSVYGDDIICQTPAAQAVIEVLETVGLKINRNKSFSRGSFRESCGADYLRGVLVAPVRLRKLLVGPGADSSVLGRCYDYVDFVNRLIRRYEIHSCEYVHGVFQKLSREWYGINLPVLPVSTMPLSKSVHWEREAPPVLAIVTQGEETKLAGFPKRWNKALQRVEYQFMVRTPRELPIVSNCDIALISKSLHHIQRRAWAARNPSRVCGRIMLRTAIRCSSKLRTLNDTVELTRSGWCDYFRNTLLGLNKSPRADREQSNVYVPRGHVKYTSRWLSVAALPSCTVSGVPVDN